MAAFTIRDLQDQVREVRVSRKVEYMPKTQSESWRNFVQTLMLHPRLRRW